MLNKKSKMLMRYAKQYYKLEEVRLIHENPERYGACFVLRNKRSKRYIQINLAFICKEACRLKLPFNTVFQNTLAHEIGHATQGMLKYNTPKNKVKEELRAWKNACNIMFIRGIRVLPRLGNYCLDAYERGL